MANRDEIIAKIRALRAKAEDAAATEAEAMSAAEFAARPFGGNQSMGELT